MARNTPSESANASPPPGDTGSPTRRGTPPEKSQPDLTAGLKSKKINLYNNTRTVPAKNRHKAKKQKPIIPVLRDIVPYQS